MKKAIIALGTNLGNRWENLSKAIRALELLPGSTTVVSCSPLSSCLSLFKYVCSCDDGAFSQSVVGRLSGN